MNYYEVQFYSTLHDEWNLKLSISNLNIAIPPISMKIPITVNDFHIFTDILSKKSYPQQKLLSVGMCEFQIF
jgi:hypothetical protein